MLHSTSISQTDLASSAASIPEREETEERQHGTGIVSHRDQFNEPGTSGECAATPGHEITAVGLKEFIRSQQSRSVTRTRPQPSVPTKPKFRTLLLTSAYSIKATVRDGRIVFHGTTIFGKNVEISMREIKSIEPIAELSDTSLEKVSLMDTAEKLFVTCEGCPYNLNSPGHWDLYLKHIVIPVIENMIEHWIGTASPGISNPVSEFFFGRKGILRCNLDRKSVIQKLRSIVSQPEVLLVNRFRGPAMVLVYEE